MPAKEIKELRQAGKLEEALKLAKEELENAVGNINEAALNKEIDSIVASAELLCKQEGKVFDYDSVKESTRISLMNFHLVWPKRNVSWVYYEYLKRNASAENFDSFIYWLNEVKKLELPDDENMLFEQLCWQIGILAFALSKPDHVNIQKSIHLFEAIKPIIFPKHTKGYSFLFKGLHKALKDSDRYLEFADWWDFESFMPEDFQKETLADGKEIMAVAEQAYIAYAKKLLTGESVFTEGFAPIQKVVNKEKVQEFLPRLDAIIEAHPSYQYPVYYKAKLLLELGNKESVLDTFLPFAKKKRNDFWVWEILAETFSDELDKVFACYCKALSCKSPAEMLVSLRRKMAGILISKKFYIEARTEIELLVKARSDHGYKIPAEILSWQSSDWYKKSQPQKTNLEFYKQYIPVAEELLFSDTPEETVIVEFVNTDKKILNFIASETKFGFLKYERFFKDAKVGDVLKVRFQGGSNEGMHQLYTAVKVNDETFQKQFLKAAAGEVRIPEGKPFGFLGDIFIHPSIIKSLKLDDGVNINRQAIKSFNKEKRQWGWKLI